MSCVCDIGVRRFIKLLGIIIGIITMDCFVPRNDTSIWFDREKARKGCEKTCKRAKKDYCMSDKDF